MTRLIDLIKNIISEMTRLEVVPMTGRLGDDEFTLPRMIDVGNGSYFIVSREVDEDIERVSKQVMNEKVSLKSKFTQAEWHRIVRRAFGPALASIDLDEDLDLNSSIVLSHVEATVGRHIDDLVDREYAFGCSLFSDVNFKSFSIGPVLFEPREVWLERKHRDGGISNISQRRIKLKWSGRKIRKRKNVIDRSEESHLIDTIGTCLFVCSVTVTNLGEEAGREKALMAARLAAACIALMRKRSSKALQDINLIFDRRLHRREHLIFVEGMKAFSCSGWVNYINVLYMKPEDWEILLKERENIFITAGQVIEYIIGSDGAFARQRMMTTLFHALVWFHEGCRETLPHVAIVKLAASLDALACGTKSGGIRTLINARLKIKDDTPVRRGGPTLKRAIELVYSESRSRSIHGNNEELKNDWSDIKSLAEQLARLCLLTCLDWVARNPNCDDPAQLRLSVD